MSAFSNLLCRSAVGSNSAVTYRNFEVECNRTLEVREEIKNMIRSNKDFSNLLREVYRKFENLYLQICTVINTRT
jgi:hypothetical protein